MKTTKDGQAWGPSQSEQGFGFWISSADPATSYNEGAIVDAAEADGSRDWVAALRTAGHTVYGHNPASEGFGAVFSLRDTQQRRTPTITGSVDAFGK